MEVGTQAKPRRPGAKRSWRAGEEEEQVPVVQAVLSPGRGWTLTRESFDGLHRPVLVGAVHEGIAGFDQELAAVGDLVLRKHFLQVRGGHALVEIADEILFYDMYYPLHLIHISLSLSLSQVHTHIFYTQP